MSTSQNDPNPQGGSLSDMAVEGTTVDPKAAEPRLIPSKPRPDQATDTLNDSNDLGATDLAGAADNATDIPRSHADKSSGEVVTAVGDTLPSEVDQKRLHNVQQGDLSKGHPRYDKHVRKEASEYDDVGGTGGGEQDQ